MSSNKKQEQLPPLYLKEFFGRYFERKQMLETISNISNGLKVLEILIENFEKGQGIRHIVKIHNYIQSGSDFLGDIDREGKHISQALENIYDRLQNIFDHWPSNREQQIDFSMKSSRKCGSFEGQDDELYEMLNKYKNDYKKQKAERIAAQKQVKELCLRIEAANEEKRTLNEEIKRNLINLNSFKQKLGEFESQNTILRQQVQGLRGKIQDAVEVQNAFNELKGDFQILTMKYEESQERQKLLTEKFNSIDAIVRAKISENEKKWQEMISQKISSTDIFSNPSCKVLRSLAKSINKENIGLQNLL